MLVLLERRLPERLGDRLGGPPEIARRRNAELCVLHALLEARLGELDHRDDSLLHIHLPHRQRDGVAVGVDEDLIEADRERDLTREVVSGVDEALLLLVEVDDALLLTEERTRILDGLTDLQSSQTLHDVALPRRRLGGDWRSGRRHLGLHDGRLRGCG